MQGLQQRGSSCDGNAYWPGNVRQLENRVKKAVIMTDRALVNADDLGIGGNDKRKIVPLNEAEESFKLRYIRGLGAQRMEQGSNGERPRGPTHHLPVHREA